jgi:hypothetical protein
VVDCSSGCGRARDEHAPCRGWKGWERGWERRLFFPAWSDTRFSTRGWPTSTRAWPLPWVT